MRALEARERRAYGRADVEAAAVRAQVPVAPPADVALELVERVEASAPDQALGEAERHRGVVGPLAGCEVERAAADDVVDRGEGGGAAELERRAECVAGGEAEEGAVVAVAQAVDHREYRDRRYQNRRCRAVSRWAAAFAARRSPRVFQAR